MKGFRDAEAATILRAAAEKRPAIRWVPFLCATSGARVGAIAQLRAEDVREVGGIPAIHITPEAGSVKTVGSERTIPLHPAVVEAGFLEFIKGRKGPLFFDPWRRKDGAKKPPQKIVAKNIAAWVRELGLDVGRGRRKDPNHAWHRFSTLAREAQIQDSVKDAIEGRAPDTVSKGYGEATLKTMLEALKRIPVPR